MDILEQRQLLATFNVISSDTASGNTYTSIQAAINAAGAANDGPDFVRVQAGN